MSDDEPITLEELTVVCAVSAEWVRERVAEGLLPERFDTLAVRRVR